MKLCVNWLPISADLTEELARRVERGGLWGLGIGDSPNYDELYASCARALAATERIVVSTSVTNPVTRHDSVHVAAARGLHRAHPGRIRLGFGRGDSAVRTFGLKPGTLTRLDEALGAVRGGAPDVPLLVAASGPRIARLAGASADGMIAGVGADEQTVSTLRTEAASNRAAASAPIEVWGSLRLAVGRDAEEIAAIRARLVPRAVSASHFAFAAGIEGRNVPDEYADVLATRYKQYDYTWHGRSGQSPNATLFADRPDIEQYLLDRFAVFGTPEQCRARLRDASRYTDGIYLSLLFEDVLDQVDRVTALFAADELTGA